MLLEKYRSKRRYLAYLRQLKQIAESMTVEEYVALELLELHSKGCIITGIIPLYTEQALFLKYYDPLRRRTVLYAISMTESSVNKKLAAEHMEECDDYMNVQFSDVFKESAIETAFVERRYSLFPPALQQLRTEMEQKLSQYHDIM